MPMKKLISIITPVFNEEENIEIYYSRISKVLEDLSNYYDFEIIFNDNCSNDKTFEKIEKLTKIDTRIRLYRFSKNYGYQKSIWFGYFQSFGDASLELDVDLQDPPELIAQMLEKWEKGFKIVYGVRENRKNEMVLKYCRKLFYRLLRKSCDFDIPNDAGDFMLIDRDVINQLKKLNLSDIYLRGIIFSFGYSRIGINYNRDARTKGYSKFKTFRLINFAKDAFVNSSVLPLKLASILGLAFMLISFLLACFFIVDKFILDSNAPQGTTAILLLVLISIAINCLFIGIMGEYIGKIYKQVSGINFIPIVEKSIENNKR